MKIKCDYCSNTYEDTQPRCPSCGAPNPSQNPTDKKPRTIEELAEWYQARKLPPYEITRFFIGINYQYPKAFGIYKDENGDFIVYKNKADGTRVIRYQGKDEQYAVHELWQKLKDEIVHQKTIQGNKVSTSKKEKGLKRFLICFAILFSIPWIIVSTILVKAGKHNGYYNYNDTYYYKDYDNWYTYDYNSDWYLTTEPSSYDETDLDPYFMGRDYDDIDWGTTTQDFILSAGGNVTDFTDVKKSEAYQEAHISNDNDYSWDSNDSWDSGGMDWDSDW